MPIARTAEDVWDYVLEEDRGAAKSAQTVFQLRALPSKLSLHLENMTQFSPSGGSATLRQGDRMELALKAGLAGWSNFRFADGKEAKFRTDNGQKVVHGFTIKSPVSEASLSLLSAAHLAELAQAIMSGNQLTTDDVKN